MDVGYLILLILAILLLVFAISVLIIIIIGFCFFNNKRREIGGIYKELRECFEARYKFIEKCENLLNKSDKKILTVLKEKCISAKNADEKVRAEEEFSEELKNKIDTIQNTKNDVSNLKNDIIKLEEKIENLVKSYNKNVMIYNEKRAKFPFKFIAKFFKFNEINLLVKNTNDK